MEPKQACMVSKTASFPILALWGEEVFLRPSNYLLTSSSLLCLLTQGNLPQAPMLSDFFVVLNRLPHIRTLRIPCLHSMHGLSALPPPCNTLTTLELVTHINFDLEQPFEPNFCGVVRHLFPSLKVCACVCVVVGVKVMHKNCRALGNVY